MPEQVKRPNPRRKMMMSSQRIAIKCSMTLRSWRYSESEETDWHKMVTIQRGWSTAHSVYDCLWLRNLKKQKWLSTWSKDEACVARTGTHCNWGTGHNQCVYWQQHHNTAPPFWHISEDTAVLESPVMLQRHNSSLGATTSIFECFGLLNI
jgi:hypothetical protein